LQKYLQSADKEKIACVSFSAAMHSFMAVDKNGKPLMNAMTWADTRSKKYAVELRNSEQGKKYLHKNRDTYSCYVSLMQIALAKK
jgi:gluconokinase